MTVVAAVTVTVRVKAVAEAETPSTVPVTTIEYVPALDAVEVLTENAPLEKVMKLGNAEPLARAAV